MLLSIQHLHNQKIIHRDVKADNFLLDRFQILDPECRVVLSDMGTAVQNSEDKLLSRQEGTKIYWSPEVVHRRFSFPADVWAIGVILYGIANGSFPFRDEQQICDRDPMVQTNGNMSASCVTFLKAVLNKNDKKRPNVEQALQLEWIKNREGREDFKMNANMNMQLEDLHVQKDENDSKHERRRKLMDLMNGGGEGLLKSQ